MKKFLVLAVAAIITMGAVAVYAGQGCCAGMSKSGAKGGACSGDMFSKLNLTGEQKAKIEALKADCRRATSTSECHDVFSKGLEKILTPEQLTQWKTQSDKAMKSGTCPFMNSGGAKANKQT
jgi:Spy/CpxP family protein refolding chaperone